MAGLFRRPVLDQKSPQWRDLHEHLTAFSKDAWAYFIEIDEGKWDQSAINTHIDRARHDIHLAKVAWPAGKSILNKMLDWFDQLIQVREQEHALVLKAPHLHPVANRKRQHRRSVKWQKAMDEMKRELNKTGEGLFACCDEIKKWTGTDLGAMLETPQIPEKLGSQYSDGGVMAENGHPF